MTQQEKSLLLQDLCARLPYGVRLKIGEYSDYTLCGIVPKRNQPVIVRLIENEREYDIDMHVEYVKPYLRPMSSMTNEDRQEYELVLCGELSINQFDWLNQHHFDYHGLIKKGLALEAPEGMYKKK